MSLARGERDVSKTTDLVIVGGGIAGLTVALAAAERGLSSVVIDQPRPGAASRAAAGMLAPSVEGLPPAVRPLALEAREYFPRFLAELQAKADLDVPVALNRNGILEVASTEEDLARLRDRVRDDAELLDQRGPAELLERCVSQWRCAAPHGRLGRQHRPYVDARSAASRERLIRRISDSVASIEVSGGRHVAWTGEGTRHEGRVMVLASGAWGSAIPGLPRALPVRPLRGQLLLLDQLPLTHVAYVAGGYLVPLPTPRSSVRRAKRLASRTASLARDRWSCSASPSAPSPSYRARGASNWRPAAGHPGRTAPSSVGIWTSLDWIYACGFSRNGTLLAPWAAAQLAALIAGEDDANLAPFSPLRFASSTTLK